MLREISYTRKDKLTNPVQSHFCVESEKLNLGSRKNDVCPQVESRARGETLVKASSL